MIKQSLWCYSYTSDHGVAAVDKNSVGNYLAE